MAKVDGIVCKGMRPWLPSPGACNLETWHADDVPTVGTFALDDDLVLFTAVGDVAAGGTTVWAYVTVAPERRDDVMSACFNTTADMSAYVRDHFANRHAAFACAKDFVITQWGTEPVGTGVGDFYKAVIAFLELATAQLNDETADLQRSSRASRRVIREQKREMAELTERYPELAGR